MYSMRHDGDAYLIEKNSQPLLTPMGNAVKTIHKSLAERLVADLREYGESPSDPVSILAFHYPMLDFFSIVPREQLELSVATGLDPQNDWTFRCPSAAPEHMMKWMALFGTSSSNVERGKEWLSSLNLRQLCAVCVLGRALESVNIPFILATVIPREDVAKYAKEVSHYYHFVSLRDLSKYFENFLFYFTIDGKPSGPGKTDSAKTKRTRHVEAKKTDR